MCLKISSIFYVRNLYLQALQTKLFEKGIREQYVLYVLHLIITTEYNPKTKLILGPKT